MSLRYIVNVVVSGLSGVGDGLVSGLSEVIEEELKVVVDGDVVVSDVTGVDDGIVPRLSGVDDGIISGLSGVDDCRVKWHSIRVKHR